jgi:hypothetical protein
MESLRLKAGFQATNVPYRGAPQVTADLLAGQFPVGFLATPAVLPHVRTGKLKTLGISSPQRSSSAPDVPPSPRTIRDSMWGFIWYCLPRPRLRKRFVPASKAKSARRCLYLRCGAGCRPRNWSSSEARVTKRVVAAPVREHQRPGLMHAHEAGDVTAWGTFQTLWPCTRQHRKRRCLDVRAIVRRDPVHLLDEETSTGMP